MNKNCLFLIWAVIFGAAEMLPDSVSGADDVRLELTVADDDLTVPGPLVVRARMRNLGGNSIFLESPFGALPGTLSFQTLAPDEETYRSFGAWMQNVEGGVGGPKIEVKSGDSVCSYEVLLPLQQTELDHKGLWKIRGVMFLKPGIPTYSEPVSLFIRELPKESLQRSQRLNGDIGHMLLESHRDRPGVSSAVLERLMTEARDLPEARDFLRFFSLLEQIRYSKTAAERIAAREELEMLRKEPMSDTHRQWTSVVAAWMYIQMNRGTLAAKELEQVDADYTERADLEKRIKYLEPIEKIRDVQTAGELNAAGQELAALRKQPMDDNQRRWAALVAARAYIHIKRGELALKELGQVDANDPERKVLEKRIRELTE
ncbi:MAG: hypothetical protein ACR2FY_03600 [Pirellulaceae bacterium]